MLTQVGVLDVCVLHFFYVTMYYKYLLRFIDFALNFNYFHGKAVKQLEIMLKPKLFVESIVIDLIESKIVMNSIIFLNFCIWVIWDLIPSDETRQPHVFFCAK